MANSSDWISSVAAGHKVSRGKQAPRVLKVLKVPKVLRELQVQQVLRELQVQQVLRELQVQLAKTEPTGPLIRQISIIRHMWVCVDHEHTFN